MKRFFPKLVYSICLITALIFIDYIFYRAYISRIFRSPKAKQKMALQTVKNIDAITISRLGYVNIDKKSCFTNFDVNKRKGYLRIGCFGDSFTHGTETSDIYDYPGILQSLFIKDGHANVEVINFGSSWYGFGQAFIMWKYVGTKYGLDYVLLGPACFQPERDMSFNHTKGKVPYYLHARFIEEKNKLKLIDVKGGAYYERARQYYKFIPLLRYLRFDSASPLFLACLIPSGRELKKNPFYYRNDGPGEIDGLHKLFLSEMADSGAEIIVGHYKGNVVRLVKELNRSGVRSAPFYHPTHFPYIAPRGHNSPFGNYVVAQQMFDLFNNKETSDLSILETKDMAMSTTVAVDKKKLCEYSGVRIEINDTVIGCFADKEIGNMRALRKPTFKGSGIAALLAIKRKKESILDATFVPLDFELKENMSVSIKRESAGMDNYSPAAGIKLLHNGLNIGVIDIDDRVDLTKKSKINIMSGGQTVSLIDILPEKYNLLALRPMEDSFIDVNELEETGIIYMSLFLDNEKKIKIPIAQWVKIKKTHKFNLPLNSR